ncbi:MAG TPA: hypothetical protein VF070_46485 [Streptosporangiaceae bacterium]
MTDSDVISEATLLEETGNGVRPEDGPQDVSQDPDVSYYQEK